MGVGLCFPTPFFKLKNMSCLKKLLCGDRVIIGIRDFDNCQNPESGLFINDIPGISLKAASKIANEEFHTGNNLIKSKIDLAIKLVFDEFTQSISNYYNFNSIIETRELNNFSDTTYQPANLDRGLILKRWRSELAQIYIESIYIKVNTTIQTIVKIIDGEITKEFTVDLVAGQTKELFVNYRAESEQVKILMNDELIETYACKPLQNSSFNFGCGSCGSKNRSNFFITGWNGTAEESKCFGIGVKAYVQCYEENVICGIIPRMYFLIWYRSGIEFLNEYINSDRLNNYTLFNKESAKKLRDELWDEYKERNNAFTKSIYNYLKSTKGECIVCYGNKYIESHP